jgi:hypothetical protein
MAELTNLTDRIAHLRERKGRSPVIPGGGQSPSPKKAPRKPQPPKAPERRFAKDYFMFFVYALLGVALSIQLGLLLWLDLV